MKGRLLAAGIHYVIGLGAMGLLALACILLWYPGALFDYAGGSQGIKLTFLLITLPLPLLTFTVYKSHKKGLVFDLITIATLHSIAFSFASYTLHKEKPELLVIAEDTIYPLSVNDVNILGYDASQLNDGRWVYVDLPLHKGQVKAIKFASELVESKGLASRFDLYLPITEKTIATKKIQDYIEFFAKMENNCAELFIAFKLTKTRVCLNTKTLKLEPVS